MIRRLGLLCFCLMCLSIVPVIYAQSPSDDWEIPQIECGEDCIRTEFVDEAGNLYILVNQYEPLKITLYVIEQGSSQITEYDMLQFYTPGGLGIRTHLVPFATGKVVIFSYTSEVPLTLFDLKTNRVVPLEIQMPGQMQECDIYSTLVSTPSIFRIGTERVLFCSRVENIGYLNVARFEGDALVLEHSIEAGESHSSERYTPPWLHLTNSLDGKVYIVFFPGAPILDRIAPQYADLTDFSTYLVLRFDPITSVWNTIVIETSSERWQVASEGVSSFAPFAGVDEGGNLYFWHYSNTLDEIRTSDLVKYDPQGQKVWHLTEANFGGEPFFFPDLIAEDKFIFNFGENNLRFISVPTPSDDWEIPQIECGEDCIRTEFVDEAGNLYLYVQRFEPTRQVILYVIKRGSSEFVEYDLLQLYSNRLGIRTFLAPFANGKVVVFNYQGVIALTLLDLQTNTVIPLDAKVPGYIEECAPSASIQLDPGIFRVGSDSILLCSRNSGTNYIHLAHLENNSLVIDGTFDMGSAVPGMLPTWHFITGGFDGKIYFSPFPNNPILHQIAPQYVEAYEPTDYLILRYDPETDIWDYIYIEASSERWMTQGTHTMSPLIGVDAIGNLYFSHSNTKSRGEHYSDLVKYDAQGRKIWHITEADFGGEAFWGPVLVAEDRFIFDPMDRVLRYIVWEEN